MIGPFSLLHAAALCSLLVLGKPWLSARAQ